MRRKHGKYKLFSFPCGYVWLFFVCLFVWMTVRWPSINLWKKTIGVIKDLRDNGQENMSVISSIYFFISWTTKIYCFFFKFGIKKRIKQIWEIKIMMLITVITISEIVKCPVVPESVPVISDLSFYCPHGTTLKGRVRYHFILHIKRRNKEINFCKVTWKRYYFHSISAWILYLTKEDLNKKSKVVCVPCMSNFSVKVLWKHACLKW